MTELFIWNIPSFRSGLVFDQVTLCFLAQCLYLLLGGAMAWLGYRQLDQLIIAALALTAAVEAAWYALSVRNNPIGAMVTFVTVLFMGFVVAFACANLFRSGTKRFLSPKVKGTVTVIASALLSCLLICGTIYLYIFRSAALCAVLALTVLTFSLWRGFRKIRTMKTFFTYDDLHRKS